jgi:hypothetical protein
MKETVLRVISAIQFLKYKYFSKIVWGKPMLGEHAQIRIREIGTGRHILEFGGGSSTVWLVKFAKSLTTVETDRKMSNALRRTLNSSCTVLYANIGPTKSFGQPINWLRIFYSKRWRAYPNVPFKEPVSATKWEVVIVDGRFRVATALTCIEKIESKFHLIIDDYETRRDYWIVETILQEKPELIDGTAFFQVNKVRHTEFEALLDKFSIIPD